MADGSHDQATVVGNTFVKRYFQILTSHPEKLHLFYKDTSVMTRCMDGEREEVVGLEGIQSIFASEKFLGMKTAVSSIDCQASNNSFLVQLTGFIAHEDEKARPFVQSFYLAPQERKGYYVLNDVFRIFDDDLDRLLAEADVGEAASSMESAPQEEPEVAQPVEEEEPAPVYEEELPEEEEEEEEPAYEPELTPEQQGYVPVPMEPQPVEVDVDAPLMATPTMEHAPAPTLPAGLDEPVPAMPADHEPAVPETPAPQPEPEAPAAPQPQQPKSYLSAAMLAPKQTAPTTHSWGGFPTQPQPRKRRAARTQQDAAPQAQPAAHAQAPAPQKPAPAQVFPVYVGHIPDSALNEARLREFFSPYGPIRSMTVQPMKKFAFIDFETQHGADEAVNAKNILDGVEIEVQHKRRGGPAGSFRGRRGPRFPFHRRGPGDGPRRTNAPL